MLIICKLRINVTNNTTGTQVGEKSLTFDDFTEKKLNS